MFDRILIANRGDNRRPAAVSTNRSARAARMGDLDAGCRRV